MLIEYERTIKLPLPSTIIDACDTTPKVLERQSIIAKTKYKIETFYNIYIKGV